MPRRSLPDGFIGYVRVSTSSQMDEGEGLRSQWLALEEYARGRKMEIEIVAATEPGHGPIAGRPQFRDAIKKAEERGWKLLVTNPSRLSRQVDHLNYVNLRKTPVWVLNEGQVSKQWLLKGVKDAARELIQLRSDGAAGASKRLSGYRTEEAKEKAGSGRRAGNDANASRAHRNRLRVRRFLEKNPVAGSMTHRELSEALNGAGLLNCKKENPILDIPWTVQSLRPVRKDVLEKMSLDAEPDCEFLVPTAINAMQEATGGPPRSVLDGRQRSSPKDSAAAVGWLQRALSKAVEVVRGLFRSVS
jgi:DNA invertase Pin-like site-specific DNA recombinase